MELDVPVLITGGLFSVLVAPAATGVSRARGDAAHARDVGAKTCGDRHFRTAWSYATKPHRHTPRYSCMVVSVPVKFG